MKSVLTIISLATAALTVGCASSTTNDASAPHAVPTAGALAYEPSTASALAFDPPIALGQPMPSFDREGRATSAFMGYEQQITVSAYTHQRDEIRVRTDFGQLDRRAYTDTVSVTTR